MSAREVPWSATSTLVDLLSRRGDTGDDRLACTFLASGRDEEGRLTYVDLDRRARELGAHLQERGLRGERAILLYRPGTELVVAFLGCFYAGVLAVPVPPPLGTSGAGLSRLLSVIEDTTPSVILCDGDVHAQGEKDQWARGPLAELPWLMTDGAPLGDAGDWRHPGVGPDDVAVLQYTSGSTAAPKGIMVTHGNFNANLTNLFHSMGVDSSWVACSWLPYYHDMGLVGGILFPLYVEFPVYLMSPLVLAQRPLRWLEAIDRYRVNLSGGPNFAYDLCVRRVSEDKRQRLDLSSWRVAFNGAEPVRARTLEAFAEAFAVSGFRRKSFYPSYGLAETTMQSSSNPAAQPPIYKALVPGDLERGVITDTSIDDPGARVLVACGAMAPGFEWAIVDPATRRPLGDRQLGELWLRGTSVAKGYWENPEATAETFQGRLAEASDGFSDGDWLRTGDLCFIDDDQLYIASRLKDLIVLDGRNHYPQDIELTVEQCHPAIWENGVIAFSVDVDDAERLVVVYAVDPRKGRKVDAKELETLVRRRVAEEHEVRVYDAVAVRPARIPKTSSGKLQRRLCRQQYLEGTFEEPPA